MKLRVWENSSFDISSKAWNKPINDSSPLGPFLGGVRITCNLHNNFCKGEDYSYWDIPSNTGHYNLRVLVYG